MGDNCVKMQRCRVDLLKNAVFVTVIFVLISVGDAGAVPVTGCGTLSTAGETYVLQNDISASETCFTIGADNITLDGAGYSITGSGGDIGVYLNGSSGVTIKNLNVSGFGGGIFLYYSSNNTITNNNASNNNNGIRLYYSSNNTITDNNASNNGGYGWGSGIVLTSSSNNNITNNTASNNDYGIYLDSSSSNTITRNIASNNSKGIHLYSSSDNLIYNNLYNNTRNFFFTGTIYSNTWTVAQATGPNIVGGPYLGGNFWAKPDGTDFSEICTDSNSDGICDLNYYNLASGNMDYLPLAFPLPTPPTIVTLQGKLTDSTTGNPVQTGSMRVTINDSSGIQVWQNTFNDVLDDGVFNIPLGAIQELNLASDRIYLMVVEIDVDSAMFSSADVTFGDNSPSGDVIKFKA